MARVVHEIAVLREAVAAARAAGARIGFVPTMGALHEGHLSLIRAARAEMGLVVVSVFVNPTQFGPGEDYERYPRTLEADAAAAASAGADLIYAPSANTMYPPGYATYVEQGGLAERLCGASRPGHFRGVCTVVAKLFNQVRPDVAYFGRKDYQQSVVVRRMTIDLDFPTEIRVCPIVREADGLAMSSRNQYLSPEERRQAVSLSRALRRASEAFAAGERSAGVLKGLMREVLKTAPLAEIDYLAVVDAETLCDVEAVNGPAVAALAVRFGKTRLIDNVLLHPPATAAGAGDDAS